MAFFKVEWQRYWLRLEILDWIMKINLKNKNALGKWSHHRFPINVFLTQIMKQDFIYGH